MRYSIIIPALNEENYIEDLLLALKNQEFSKDKFEIIVIDNGSTDATHEIAKKYTETVFIENARGTNAARNRGIKEAKGDILIFLDADTKPHQKWLLRLDLIMQDHSLTAVSGPYDYEFKGIKKIFSFLLYEIAFEYVGPIMSFIFRKKVSALMGGNFAVRKEFITAIGGFPEIPFWGDDTAISMKIMAHGGNVIFTRKIKLYSSDRRYRSEGFIKLSLKYFYHFFKMYFTFHV